MAKRKPGDIKVLPHERLVEVDLGGKKKIKGVVFGGDRVGNVYVCLARPELEQAGITGHGPCVNKIYAEEKVTYLKGAVPLVLGEKEDEEEDV